jgi:hypothetical protein
MHPDPGFWHYNAAMVPLANILLDPVTRPLAHGAVGIWDEVLNMIPLVFGSGLLFYLYLGRRKRRATNPQPPATEANLSRPPDEQPHP